MRQLQAKSRARLDHAVAPPPPRSVPRAAARHRTRARSTGRRVACRARRGHTCCTCAVHVCCACVGSTAGMDLVWDGSGSRTPAVPWCGRHPGGVGGGGGGVARWRRRVTLLTERRYCSAGLAAPRIQRLRLRPRPSSSSSGARARSSGARARSVGGRDSDGIAEARERRQCGPYLGSHRIAPWMHRVAGLQA